MTNGKEIYDRVNTESIPNIFRTTKDIRLFGEQIRVLFELDDDRKLDEAVDTACRLFSKWQLDRGNVELEVDKENAILDIVDILYGCVTHYMEDEAMPPNVIDTVRYLGSSVNHLEIADSALYSKILAVFWEACSYISVIGDHLPYLYALGDELFPGYIKPDNYTPFLLIEKLLQEIKNEDNKDIVRIKSYILYSVLNYYCYVANSIMRSLLTTYNESFGGMNA